MRPNNKYLRRKAKPDIRNSEKTIKPKVPTKRKLKYPKQTIEDYIEKFMNGEEDY